MESLHVAANWLALIWKNKCSICDKMIFAMTVTIEKENIPRTVQRKTTWPDTSLGILVSETVSKAIDENNVTRYVFGDLCISCKVPLASTDCYFDKQYTLQKKSHSSHPLMLYSSKNEEVKKKNSKEIENTKQLRCMLCDTSHPGKENLSSKSSDSKHTDGIFTHSPFCIAFSFL